MSGSVAEKQKPDSDQQKSSQPDKPDGLTVYSIKEVKSFPDKTEVSVEGKVTKIQLVKKKKVKRQQFQLEDETDSIEIVMWREATELCKKLSVGDVVKVTNMKTNEYSGKISLYSTDYTRIEKMGPDGAVKPKTKTGSRSIPTTSRNLQGMTSECTSTSGSGDRKRKPAAGTTSTLAADSGLTKKQKTADGPSEAIAAEEKLFKVRTEFVKRVSDANLNQLLDKLLEDGVINDEEMRSVKTKITAEKARDLIDTVRKKGNKACSLFIDTLREVDPLLSEKLN